MCGMVAGESVNITLSVCGDGKYTCADGTCINLENRCDLRLDCPDFSDEAHCSVVDIPKDYHITIPPPPTTEGKPLPIYFTINIISFPSIATEDLTFMTSFELKLRWYDTRLNYLNLKDDRTLNVLSKESSQNIWTPQLFFSNAFGNVFTNLDQSARIECIQEAESVPGGPSLPDEGELLIL